MGEPEFIDGHFMSDSNLTNHDYWVKDNEPFYGVCPVCGSEATVCTDERYEDYDSTLIRSFHCCNCKSNYSFTYWVKAIVIYNDGRFHKEN